MISDIGYFVLGLYLALLRKLWMCWTIAGSENLPQGVGIILASNHIHWIDIFVIEGSIPEWYKRAWLAKVELVSNPITAWLGKQAHLIPIRRGQIDKEALVAAEEAIRGGRALVIYPEGHRSSTGGLQQGHGGAIALALRTGCPIVPMAVWGTETGLKGALQRKPIHVQFGRPYHPQAAESDSMRQAMDKRVEEMMLQIAALLPPQYRGVYRESLEAKAPHSS
jgi:1-acyl-sn-glycerol-3-phosphate acyltransferase